MAPIPNGRGDVISALLVATTLVVNPLRICASAVSASSLAAGCRRIWSAHTRFGQRREAASARPSCRPTLMAADAAPDSDPRQDEAEDAAAPGRAVQPRRLKWSGRAVEYGELWRASDSGRGIGLREGKRPGKTWATVRRRSASAGHAPPRARVE